eukprot:Platyproteum_vivax@DN7608_c0_g1_i2.p1
MALSNKVLLCSLFVCLLVGNHFSVADNLSRQNIDVEVDANAEVMEVDAEARELGATTIEPVTFVPVAFTHKAEAENFEVEIGLKMVGTATPLMKLVTIEAPANYEFAADCVAVNGQRGQTDLNLTINGTPYTAKGFIGTVGCAKDSTDSKIAKLSLSVVIPANALNSITTFKFMVLKSPAVTPASNKWKVSYDGRNNKETVQGSVVQNVLGWPSAVGTPADKLGTPSTTAPSLRPTSFDGNKAGQAIGFYMLFSTQIEAGKGFFFVIGSSYLAFEKTGDCAQKEIGATVQVCVTGTCTKKDIGTIKSSKIDPTTKAIGCTASSSGMVFITKDAIVAGSGVYVHAKVKSSKFTDKDKTAGKARFGSCNVPDCPATTKTAYKAAAKYVDFGESADDVKVKKVNGSFQALVSSVVVALVSFSLF